MKTCPFCNEEIKEVAKKCRYCGRWLNGLNRKSADNGPNNEHVLQLENKLLSAACVVLGIAVVWVGGYGYYMFSRLVIFIIMLYLFIKNRKHKGEDESKLWLYGITGLIYNPLLSISLTSFLRIIVDLVTMVLLYQRIRTNKGEMK